MIRGFLTPCLFWALYSQTEIADYFRVVSLYSPLPSPFHMMPPGNWQRASQLESLITRATTAAQPENNYALHIEIAEYINKKKANTYISIS